MDRILKRLIATEAAKLIPRGENRDYAKKIGTDPSQLSRFLRIGTGLSDAKAEDLAGKLGILERLRAEAKEAGNYRVGYCPRAQCKGASLFIDGDDLYIKPFFHIPVEEFCPFCLEVRLLKHCTGEKSDGTVCAAGIRVGARSCTGCGQPYVATPVEYLFADPQQLAEFVRETMAARREIVQEYVSRSGVDRGS